MQVTLKAASSVLDNDTVLIETSVQIGDTTTSQRVGYDRRELMDNRFLSGTFEDRVEALRQSAERVTEHSLRNAYAAIMKAKEKPIEITEVAKIDYTSLEDRVVAAMEKAAEKPVKKPRARKSKSVETI